MSFFDLKDKTIFVTGGSRGIGAAIVKRLAKANARIIFTYRSQKEQADQVLAFVRASSPLSEALCLDVSDNAQMESAIAEVLERVGTIHGLVCNAGLSEDALLVRSKSDHFEHVLKTNLLGTMNAVRVFSRSMMKQRYGRIVLMGSVVGQMGNTGQAAYAASKSGLEGFAKSVARELGSRNVTCNVLHPGFIETEMTARLDEATRASYMSRIPLGRFAQTDEVAAAVHYLMSEEGSYMTGTAMSFNGGLWMV